MFDDNYFGSTKEVNLIDEINSLEQCYEANRIVMKQISLLLRSATWAAMTLDYYTRGTKESSIGRFKWSLYNKLDRLKSSHLKPTVSPVVEIDAANYSFDALKQLTDQFTSPVVVRGLFSQSASVKKWRSPEFFTHNYGEQSFLVQEKWQTRPQIDTVLNAEISANKKSTAGADDSQKMRLKDIISRMLAGEPLYVNNLDAIFRNNAALLEDLEIPYRVEQWWEGPNQPLNPVMVQLFMGMGAPHKQQTTGTPMHCARHANFFIQVVGSKKWTLIQPKYSLFLRPLLSYHVPACLSDTMPEVTETLPRQEVILNPGDALFNPPWMWHQVENMPGFNVGCATRELRFLGSMKNNPMFTILQEFTEMNAHFDPPGNQNRLLKALISIPFFVYSLASLQEMLRGYVSSPIRAYGDFDEHIAPSHKTDKI